MGDTVHVAYGDDQAATARALLDAADGLDLDSAVVQLDTGTGTFVVPEQVASKAKGVKATDPHEEHATKVAEALAAKEDLDPEQSIMAQTLVQPDPDEASKAVGNVDPGPSADEAYEKQLEDSPPTEPQAPAKKAAKKAPAKKAAAKKSTAKKGN